MKWQKSLRSRHHAWLMPSESPCAKSTGRKGGKVRFYQRLENDRGLFMNRYFGLNLLCVTSSFPHVLVLAGIE